MARNQRKCSRPARSRSTLRVIRSARNSKRVHLTSLEFKLLRTLIQRRGRVQERDKLLNDVWGYESMIDTRTVDTHVRRLREKLGKAGELYRKPCVASAIGSAKSNSVDAKAVRGRLALQSCRNNEPCLTRS